ncbi:MAG: acyltransferase [Planctomycetota bacterium]
MESTKRKGWILDGERERRVVDGVRALGIVLVVAFHGSFLLAKSLPRESLANFIDRLPPILNVVWQALGSEIVFLASGFLLAYLLLREKLRYGSIDMRDFGVRRLSRIVPLFLIALGVYMLGRKFHLDRFVANLFFVARVTGEKNYIPVGWSLEVMMQVYLALPFVVMGLVASRRPLLVTGVLVVASVVPRYVALASDPSSYAVAFHELVNGSDAPQVQKDLYYLTWYRLTPFLLGIAAAIVATVHRERATRWFRSPVRASLTFLLGALLFVSVGFLPIHDPEGFVYDLFVPETWHWFWTLQRPVLATGVALMLLSVLFHDRGPVGLAGRFLTLRLWSPISQGIYSIYLFHFVCLIPAALLVFSPAVVRTLATAESFDRVALQEQLSNSLVGVTVWHYLAIVFVATWLATKLAGFLTRRVEVPTQEWLRARYRRVRRELLPEFASEELHARPQVERTARIANGEPQPRSSANAS